MKKRELYLALIHQGNHNLIPFSCEIQNGFEYNDRINFELKSHSYLDYSNIINFETIENENHGTYIPQDKYDNITHSPWIDIEIIGYSKSGIKKYSHQSNNNLNIKKTYNLPKFSWEIPNYFEKEKITNSLWIGGEHKINHINYIDDSAINISELNLTGKVKKIVFDKNNCYITTNQKIYHFKIEEFVDDDIIDSKFQIQKEINNNNREIIDLLKDGILWSLCRYTGKIITRNAENFEIINQFEGFDAPKKIIWSKFHKDYFIAGTNILWKFDEGNYKAIYYIENYEIIDFDISDNGQICLIFNSYNNGLIKILHHNLHGTLLHEIIEESVLRFCTYCHNNDNKLFYILSEFFKYDQPTRKIEKENNYKFNNYIFNIQEQQLSIIEKESDVYYPVEINRPEELTKKVNIYYPDSNSSFIKGEKIEILWDSTESINDYIRLELIRHDEIFSIIDETPNNGIYTWEIPSDLEEDSEYQIKITWIGATELPINIDISEKFMILDHDIIDPLEYANYSIGIKYDTSKNHIINVLNNGLMGYFDLYEEKFYGLFEIKDNENEVINNVSCLGKNDIFHSKMNNINAIRIFVGSKENLSDMWDSGIIETDANSIYYGGGNNLIPGNTYYLGMQFRDEDNKWSKVQKKEFKMPN